MAVDDSHVFRGFLTPVLTQISLFSHASEEVRGENTPERNFATTESRTHNHQVISLTGSPLSHAGGGQYFGCKWPFRTQNFSYLSVINHSSIHVFPLFQEKHLSTHFLYLSRLNKRKL